MSRLQVAPVPAWDADCGPPRTNSLNLDTPKRSVRLPPITSRSRSTSESTPGQLPSARITVSSRSGVTAVHEKIRREASSKRLTYHEKKNAVGGWIFGEGGLRGLAGRKPDDFIENVADDSTSAEVRKGLSLDVPGRKGHKAHYGPSRLDRMVDQYYKQTTEYHRKHTNASVETPMALAVMARATAQEKWYRKLWRHVVRSWHACTSCMDEMWNGPPNFAAGDADAKPIEFSGMFRKILQRVGAGQDELKVLRDVFRKMDYNNLGGVALLELFQYLNEPPTPILDRLYAQLVETQLGYQPFGKVLTLEAFCGFVLVFGLLNRAEILKFVFDSFDVDGDQFLNEEEVCNMLAVINSDKPFFPGNLETLMQNFDTNMAGLLSYQTFVKLSDRFPLALFPIFRLHDKIQSSTLGTKAFLRLARHAAPLRQANPLRSSDTQPTLSDEEGESKHVEAKPTVTMSSVPRRSTGAGTPVSRGRGASDHSSGMSEASHHEPPSASASSRPSSRGSPLIVDKASTTGSSTPHITGRKSLTKKTMSAAQMRKNSVGSGVSLQRKPASFREVARPRPNAVRPVN